MNHITTHILDTSIGRPAAGVKTVLFQQINSEWIESGRATTNEDGRISEWEVSDAGIGQQTDSTDYKLVFQTSAYFQENGIRAFYPRVEIVFTIDDSKQHYHVPLLLNPYGYSTYRGS